MASALRRGRRAASRLRADGPGVLRRGAIPLTDGHATSSRLESARRRAIADPVGQQATTELELEAQRQREATEAEAEGREPAAHDPDPVATNAKEMHSLLLSAYVDLFLMHWPLPSR